VIRGQFRGGLELDQRRRLVSRRFQGLASQEFRWAYPEGLVNLCWKNLDCRRFSLLSLRLNRNSQTERD